MTTWLLQYSLVSPIKSPSHQWHDHMVAAVSLVSPIKSPSHQWHDHMVAAVSLVSPIKSPSHQWHDHMVAAVSLVSPIKSPSHQWHDLMVAAVSLKYAIKSYTSSQNSPTLLPHCHIMACQWYHWLLNDYQLCTCAMSRYSLRAADPACHARCIHTKRRWSFGSPAPHIDQLGKQITMLKQTRQWLYNSRACDELGGLGVGLGEKNLA